MYIAHARIACSTLAFSALVLLGAIAGGCANKSAPAPATQPLAATPAPAPQPSGYEWRNLFDGKTLANWKKAEFGGEGTPSVKDGAIVIPVGDSLSGIAWTGPALPKINYEVELEAKKIDGGDFFCGLTVPYKDSHVSLVLGGWGGQMCGISSLDGYDAANNETSTTRNFETGRWYRVRFRVIDGRLQGWLDDEELVDIDTTNRKVDIRIDIDSCLPFGVANYQTSSALRYLRVRTLRLHEIQLKPEDK